MLRASVFFNKLCHMNIALGFMQIKDKTNTIKLNQNKIIKFKENSLNQQKCFLQSDLHDCI